MPPIPPWNAAHPALVHLPIGVLVLVPMLALLALVLVKHRTGLSIAAAVALVVGTIGAQVAVMSGEAAAEVAVVDDRTEVILHEHEESTERARMVFIGVSVVMLAGMGWSIVARERAPKWAMPATLGVVLVSSGVGLVMLANAAHLGGRLVHEYGIRAPLVTPP